MSISIATRGHICTTLTEVLTEPLLATILDEEEIDALVKDDDVLSVVLEDEDILEVEVEL